MIFVIEQPCVDVTDRACVDEGPVDCIYEGRRAPVCPVEAIYYEDDLPDELTPYLGDDAAFFNNALHSREEPLGSPGGAAKIGPLGVDTPLVADLPAQEADDV